MTPKYLSITRRAALALAVALTAACHFGAATAQPRVTRLIVGFPAGGPVDFVARTIGESLGTELGTQVIVENKPGANGAIAAEYVTRAVPDGSTLWLTSVGAVSINPALYGTKLPYDTERDLAPISLVVNNVAVLVVGNDNKATTGSEFVARARETKQGATVASTGTGSIPHLGLEILADASKATLLHVPYKGAAPAITDVIAGHVDGFFVDIPGVINFIKAGKLKPIGVAAGKRNALLPEVKTFKEMGMPAVELNNWFALYTGKGVPVAEIDRINAALRRTLASEGVRAKLLASGAEPAPTTPAVLAQLARDDSAKWGNVIRAKKIQAEQ